jgi:hypothetical protein
VVVASAWLLGSLRCNKNTDGVFIAGDYSVSFGKLPVSRAFAQVSQPLAHVGKLPGVK